MVVATMAWLQHPVLKVRASHLALRMPVEEADTCRGTGSIILTKRFELSWLGRESCISATDMFGNENHVLNFKNGETKTFLSTFRATWASIVVDIFWNRTVARWRHYITTTRILQWSCFLVRIFGLCFLLNPQRDWQIYRRNKKPD